MNPKISNAARAMQKSIFESLVVTHGDFESAYADLAEQFDQVVAVDSARRWFENMSKEEKKDEARRQLSVVLGGQALDTRIMAYRELNPEQQLDVFDEELKKFAFSLVADHGHEIFEPKDRVTGIPKMAELMGSPQRIQRAKQNTPQQAHRDVEHIASTFGTLRDRQVMILYVQEGEDVTRLTNALRMMDPDQLGALTPDTVGGKLRDWKRRGVVMDSEGNVQEWDVALDLLRHGLRTLPGV